MENITGKRLEFLRERKGWTKSLVAKKLGIKTVSTYANWEYGLRQPDSEMLVKIANLYDVSVDYILGRHEHAEGKEKVQGMWFYDMESLSEEDFEEIEEEVREYAEFLLAKKKKRSEKDS